MSPGRAASMALWSSRLSPGRSRTVTAQPHTHLPGATGWMEPFMALKPFMASAAPQAP